MLDSKADDNPNLDFLLGDLVAELGRWTEDGRKVFVHCVQAENRTPTVALAWLRHAGVPTDAALAQVTTALNRPRPFLIAAALRL
jgi:protein-tyrosine phosphatase